MIKTAMLRFMLTGILSLLLLFGSIASATSQWGAPGSQQQYPKQQQYPGTQATQPTQPWNATGAAAQGFRDVFGRFSANLPAGAVPMGATYNFNVPSSMCQVSIMSMPQEQMFQMQQQNFSNMMRQMGGTIDTDQPTDVNGRQARFIAVTMRDQNTGMSTHSMNVFISGPGLWIQVMGPEQNTQQIGQVYSAVMSGLQF